MALDRKEFLDIVFLANHLGRLDGELQKSEKRVLMSVLEQIGVTKDELQEMKQMVSLNDSADKLTSDESKQALLDVLLLVALADGNFDAQENEFILKIMKRVHLNPDDFSFFTPGTPPDSNKIKEDLNRIMKDII